MSAQLLERRDARGFRRLFARPSMVQPVTDERHEQTLAREVTLWYGWPAGPTVLPAGTPITVLSIDPVGLARIRYHGLRGDYATIDVEHIAGHENGVRSPCDPPDIG